jgi:hypothetical protein
LVPGRGGFSLAFLATFRLGCVISGTQTELAADDALL